jgi:hypothetical protein
MSFERASGLLALIQAGPWSEQSPETSATDFAAKLENKGGIKAAQRINHNDDSDLLTQHNEFCTVHYMRPHHNPRQKAPNCLNPGVVHD